MRYVALNHLKNIAKLRAFLSLSNTERQRFLPIIDLTIVMLSSQVYLNQAIYDQLIDSFRIDYNNLLLVHKVLNGLSPVLI